MDINAKVEGARIGGGAVLVTIWGLTLNEWVAVVTILYFVLQIIILTPKALERLKAVWKNLPGVK